MEGWFYHVGGLAGRTPTPAASVPRIAQEPRRCVGFFLRVGDEGPCHKADLPLLPLVLTPKLTKVS